MLEYGTVPYVALIDLVFLFSPGSMSSIRHKTTKLTKQKNIPIMATLKRPLEITLDSLHPYRAPPKKRRQYYEQLHQIELYHNIENSKQSRLKKYQRRERVKFALFLKYLVHYLFFTDQDKYKKAKQASFSVVRLSLSRNPHLIIHNCEYFSFLLDCSRLHKTSAGRHAWRSSSDVGRERPSIRIGKKRIWTLRGDFKKIHQDLWFQPLGATPGTKE